MPNATTPVLVQGDREFYPEDIDHIRIVVQRFPGLPRKEVVLTLCETNSIRHDTCPYAR